MAPSKYPGSRRAASRQFIAHLRDVSLQRAWRERSLAPMVSKSHVSLTAASKAPVRARCDAARQQILPYERREAWARESPLDRGGRAGYVISPCLPKLRALPPPLRKTAPLDLLE